MLVTFERLTLLLESSSDCFQCIEILITVAVSGLRKASEFSPSIQMNEKQKVKSQTRSISKGKLKVKRLIKAHSIVTGAEFEKFLIHWYLYSYKLQV